MSKADIEQKWVEAWNDLYALVGDQWNGICILPYWREASIEACKEWLQSSVYEGYDVHLKVIWHRGRKAVSASRKKIE